MKRKTPENKTKVKDYVHEAKTASQARLNIVAGLSYEIINKNLVQKKEVLIDGSPAESNSNRTLTSAELSLFDFVNYTCTHHPKTIKPIEDDPVFSIIPGVPWDAFINIVSNGTKGQKDLIQHEITRYSTNTPGRVVNLKDRPVKTALFNITLHSKEGKLNARELQRLGALKAFPVEKIDIRFVKELFESVITNKNAYSNLPTGWNAKVRKQIINKSTLTGIEGDNIAITAATYEKAWAYLNIHDNGSGNYKMVNVKSFLLETTGMTYLSFKKNVLYLREEPKHNAYAFLANVVKTLSDVSNLYKDNLNFQLNNFRLEEDIFDIEKFKKEDKKQHPYIGIKKIITTMMKEYDGYIRLSVTRNPELNQPELLFPEKEK